MRNYFEINEECSSLPMDFSGWFQRKYERLDTTTSQERPVLRNYHEERQRRLSILMNRLAELNRIANISERNTINIINHDHEQTNDHVVETPIDLSTNSRQSGARKNKRLRNREKFPCELCGQTFLRRDNMIKHKALRHRNVGPDGVKQYKCIFCNKTFGRSDMLKRHVRVHTGIKPYSCRTCDQCFSRSDHLTTHERTHTGEKPYQCSVCSYAACRRDMITRHMKTHMTQVS